MAERDTDRVMSHILSWRDEMYRETLRALHWRRSDPPRSRLGGTIMGAAQGMWEDPLQRVCNMHTRVFKPQQQLAQDKQVWQELEALFVQTLMPQGRASEVPDGRWILGDTPPA